MADDANPMVFTPCEINIVILPKSEFDFGVLSELVYTNCADPNPK
jgi:hypothetical protein